MRVFEPGRPEDGMNTYLECVDPASNRFRAYHVAIEADLFVECALVVSWGRIGRPGRTRVVGSGDAASARVMAERLLRRRARHGYGVVREVGLSQAADLYGFGNADVAPGETVELHVIDIERAKLPEEVAAWDAAERGSR